ncbi:MAG: thiamine-phosphate kinase [Candidatus Omnitrophota bacterium]
MGKRTLKDIGEFGFIRHLKKTLKAGAGVRVGVGDDAAVLRVNAGKELLLTSDMILEGRHFRLRDARAFEIGWKAMAVNVSDIAAMGGLPTFAVVSVGLPANLTLNFVNELNRGLRAAASRFGARIVGGDTNRSEKIVLSVALLGEAGRGRAVTRSGARVGDVVFVTGSLGGSTTAKKHLRFVPRIKESQFLVKNFKIHAMIDISDGLVSDLRRVAEESGVGFTISGEAIPVSRSAKSLRQALTEGEDFELLFTLSPKEAARLGALSPKGLASFHPIGRVVAKRLGLRLMRADGKSAPLPGKGFDHFK